MTPAEVLRAAKEKINTPEKFTSHAWARNIDGRSVSYDDETAVCFCSAGAIRKVSPTESKTYERATAILFLCEAVAPRDIFVWSDNSTHEEVMAGFDAAIALAEAA